MVLPADYLVADHASVGPRCVGDHQEAERDHPRALNLAAATTSPCSSE